MCSGILAHFEDKFSVSGLHADFATKEQTAQLKGLLTKEVLRMVGSGRNKYAVDTVFQLAATLTDRSLGSVERCDLTGMSILYSRMVRRMFFNRNCGDQ